MVMRDTGGVMRRLKEAQERCDQLAQLAKDAERAVEEAEHLAQATSLGPGGATGTTAKGELNEGRHQRQSHSPSKPSDWDGDSWEVGRCWALCSSPGPALALGHRIPPNAAMAREVPWSLPQARDGRGAGVEVDAFPVVYEWQSHDLPLQGPSDSQAGTAPPLAKTAGVTVSKLQSNDALLLNPADRHLDAIQRMNAFAPAGATRATSPPPCGHADAALPAGGDEATRRGVFDRGNSLPPQEALAAEKAAAWSPLWSLRKPETAGTLGPQASAAATKMQMFELSHQPGTFGRKASVAATKTHKHTLRMFELSHQMPDPVWLEECIPLSQRKGGEEIRERRREAGREEREREAEREREREKRREREAERKEREREREPERVAGTPPKGGKGVVGGDRVGAFAPASTTTVSVLAELADPIYADRLAYWRAQKR